MHNSIVVLASLACLVRADFAANVSAEVSDAKQQPRGSTAIKVQANDTLYTVQNDSQIPSSALDKSVAELTYKARNSVVREMNVEIKRHDGDANAMLPADASEPVVRQEVTESPLATATMKPKSRNGVVRVSTAAPASYISSVLKNGGSMSAKATSHIGVFREGFALTCLAVLVLWLTRKSLWTMWEEVVDPNGQSQKFEASLDGKNSKPKRKPFSAHDFGTPNDVSESFEQNTDCFQRRLDQVLQNHRIPVPSSPRNCEPTL